SDRIIAESYSASAGNGPGGSGTLESIYTLRHNSNTRRNGALAYERHSPSRVKNRADRARHRVLPGRPREGRPAESCPRKRRMMPGTGAHMTQKPGAHGAHRASGDGTTSGTRASAHGGVGHHPAQQSVHGLAGVLRDRGPLDGGSGGGDLPEHVDDLLAPAHEVAGRHLRLAQHLVEALAGRPHVGGPGETEVRLPLAHALRLGDAEVLLQ